MGQIWIFGHRPSKLKGEFETESEMLDWMKEGLFEYNKGRYRYTLIRKKASTIVVSFDGRILGYFKVVDSEKPKDDDRQQYGKSKWVYVVNRSRVFEMKNVLSKFGISKIRFGHQIDEDTFEEIIRKGGHTDDFPKT